MVNEPPRTTTQASRVIAKFGNARRLAALLKHYGLKPSDPANVYRWDYPRSRGGSDGIIPTSALSNVLKVARLEGIYLSDDDMRAKRK